VSIPPFSFVSDAFNDLPALTEVIFLESVTLKRRAKLSAEEQFYRRVRHVEIDSRSALQEIYGFRDCIALRTIIIPASVAIIRKPAFWNCRSLSHVTFEDNSQLVRIRGFKECPSLLRLEIPPSVISLDLTAFTDSKAQSEIVFPKGTKIERVDLRSRFRRHVFLTFSCVECLQARRRRVHTAHVPFSIPEDDGSDASNDVEWMAAMCT
jgi:hypothetical protein